MQMSCYLYLLNVNRLMGENAMNLMLLLPDIGWKISSGVNLASNLEICRVEYADDSIQKAGID